MTREIEFKLEGWWGACIVVYILFCVAWTTGYLLGMVG